LTIRLILLLAAFLPSLPFCFVFPFYGIVLWTIFAFVEPQWYTFGGRILPWSLAVAIPTILGFAVFGRGWNRLLTRETSFLLVLWSWFGFTTIICLNTPFFASHAADAQSRFWFVSKILLMTFLMLAVVNSFERLRTLLWVIAACFGLFVVKAFPFLLASEGTFRTYGPPNSMIADNNDYGLALNMTLPIFFFLARSEPRPWLRRVCWALFFMTIPSILFTWSRGAMVGLCAIMLLMFLKLKQRAVLIPVLVFGVVLGALFAPEKWKERMNPTQTADASAQSRFNSWTYCWRLAKDFPLTGGGFDAFTPDLFDRYAPNPQDVHGPHSIYFGVLAEHGFPGLFLYLLLVGNCFRILRRVARQGAVYGDQTAVQYAHMFQFSLVGFLTSGAFLGRAYFDYFFTIVACLIILKRLCFAAWAAGDFLEGPGLPEEGAIDSSPLPEAV
jgi:probable O-glycosylation ligase (exosortase A-associated)